MNKLPLLVFIGLMLICSEIFAQTQEKIEVVPTSETKIELSPETMVTLDLKNVTLEEALRLITEKTGMKFVIRPDLAEKVISIYLPDVRGEDALDAILSMHGLDYTRKKNTDIYIIEVMREALPLEIEAVVLKYAKAKDIGEIIKSNLSSNGQVSIDERTNTVIIRDLPKNIEEVKILIEKLDHSLTQVLIRADIVELSTDAEKELGVEWGGDVSASGASQQTTFPFYTDKGTVENKLRQVYNNTGGLLSTGGQVPTFTFGNISFADLSVTLHALETKGLAKILANPRIAVQNDHSANINITNHIAMALKTTYDDAGNIVSTEPLYGDIGVEMTTTPHITDEGDVILEIEPSVSSAEESLVFDNVVNTTKRSAKTIIKVKDEGTAVIGGLLRRDTTKTITKVPFLGSIPLVGLLFRYNYEKEVSTDLVVFISPIILTEEKAANIVKEDKATIERMEKMGTTDTKKGGNKGYLMYK